MFFTTLIWFRSVYKISSCFPLFITLKKYYLSWSCCSFIFNIFDGLIYSCGHDVYIGCSCSGMYCWMTGRVGHNPSWGHNYSGARHGFNYVLVPEVCDFVLNVNIRWLKICYIWKLKQKNLTIAKLNCKSALLYSRVPNITVGLNKSVGANFFWK